MTINNLMALGAGVMGSQVSFYHAMRGANVTQFDISEEALAACKEYHCGYVDAFRAVNPSFTDADIEAGLARINYSSDLEAAAQNADLVIESVPEVLEIKQKVYADLDRFCPPHTIFTTNTSTLRPSAIAPSTGRPERFLALHYSNGIWNAPIAEVMKHPGTDDTVFQEIVGFAQASELVPIKLEKEQPGYIINSLLVPWLVAGLSLVVNGISSHQDVDKTWMICSRGMQTGPMGVLDQVGFEVARNVFRLQAAAEPNNPQYQKNIDYLEKHFINRGLTGVLGGQGFYRYPNPEYEEPDFLKCSS
jgi:3-hydroxyacyl-CoA dehydrogenase